MGTRQGKGTLGQGWAKTCDKSGTRIGTGLEARLGPWPIFTSGVKIWSGKKLLFKCVETHPE